MKDIRIAVSTCLLGQDVRYDGRNKRDRLLTEHWARWVELVPICPEAEAGFGIPREPVQVVEAGTRRRLVTVETRRDLTDQLEVWISRRLDELESQPPIHGAILKARSPSCEPFDLEIFDGQGKPTARGVGLWAGALARRFPWLPIEREDRLDDWVHRENFIDRVLLTREWFRLRRQTAPAPHLAAFHRRHELLFAAHDQGALSELEAAVESSGRPRGEDLDHYQAALFNCLQRPATIESRHRALSIALERLTSELPPLILDSVRSAVEHARHDPASSLFARIALHRLATSGGATELANQSFLAMDAPEIWLRLGQSPADTP